MDVAIPADRNVVQKEARKGSKIEFMYRERYMKCMIIPVITGANGISKQKV
jgi:hypothetical protein